MTSIHIIVFLPLLAALIAGLGQRFEFEQLSYKPYPCCRFNHTAIDATLAMLAVASGEVTEAQFADWIRKHAIPRG